MEKWKSENIEANMLWPKTRVVVLFRLYFNIQALLFLKPKRIEAKKMQTYGRTNKENENDAKPSNLLIVFFFSCLKLVATFCLHFAPSSASYSTVL